MKTLMIIALIYTTTAVKLKKAKSSSKKGIGTHDLWPLWFIDAFIYLSPEYKYMIFRISTSVKKKKNIHLHVK